MDFHHPYFRLNKFFLSAVGLWPYQSTSNKILYRCLFVILMGNNVPILFRTFFLVWGDADEVVNSLVLNVTGVITTFKFISSMFLNEKMKHLLGRIKSDWDIWSTQEEVNILEKYANEGRKITLLYTVALSYYVVVYLSFTLSPVILDYVVPLMNGTRPKKYALPEDFGIDHEKYYYYIFVHNSIGIVFNYVLAIAIDTIYFVYVQHVCGVFSAVGQRLEHITEKFEENNNNFSKNTAHQEIFFCIKQHVSAIQYAEELESTYVVYFFVITGIYLLLLTFTGVQVVIQLGNFDDCAKFANYTVLLVGQLFIYSIPGQRLLDHSLLISQTIYSSYWYRMPSSIRRTLLMMMMRSSKPCKMTAGKISIISMQSFSAVLRAAASYFTVLMSMR